MQGIPERERESIRKEQREDSGGDAPGGNTRTHPEHDG